MPLGKLAARHPNPKNRRSVGSSGRHRGGAGWCETGDVSDTGGVGGVDPGLVAIAAELSALARDTDRRPFVVGLAGSVAVGKSTVARRLAELLADTAPGVTTGDALRVEVVATDSFLLPNDQLGPLGGAMVKGYPQSYDWTALQRFLAEAGAGSPVLSVPIYSHEEFDVVAGAQHVMSSPDVLIVEGLNLLQGPPAAPIDLTDHLHRTIYLDAPAPVIEDWFVQRFLATTHQEHTSPNSFYAAFDGMGDDEVESVARWTWQEINAPNLHQHIAPTRDRADVVVHKAADHSIERIQHRR